MHFHITAGAFFGQSYLFGDGTTNVFDKVKEIKEKAPAIGATLPDKFEMNGVVLKPNSDNKTFGAKLVMGIPVKPYFGLGFGRTISNSRVGFNFDLGLVYSNLGELKFKSDNITGDKLTNTDVANLQLGDDVKKWLKFYPLLNFTLTVRIF